MGELTGRVYAGRQVMAYGQLCMHVSLGLPQWKAPIGYPYMLRSIESTEKAINETFLILQVWRLSYLTLTTKMSYSSVTSLLWASCPRRR